MPAQPNAALPTGQQGPGAAAGGEGIGVRPPTSRFLADVFDSRRNGLAHMRLGLAGVVAVSHALALGFGFQPRLFRTDLSGLAVDAFFVLSGFLVTRSYVRLGSFWRYAWHRFLRIIPGFWVCLLLTAAVAAPVGAMLAGRGMGSVLVGGPEPAWRYVLVNAPLPILQYGIGGVGTTSGDVAFDGSLWTLQYEAFCYGLVAVLGVLALLHRRRGAILVLAGVVWLVGVLDATGTLVLSVPLFTEADLYRLVLVFLLGAAGALWADRLPMRWPLAAASAAAVLAGAAVENPQLVVAPCFAYLCLYAAARLRPRRAPRWDLSYGVYVYHWPIEFLLALAGASALGPWGFTTLSVAITVGLAALSWLVVEMPALARKDARLPRLLARPGAA